MVLSIKDIALILWRKKIVLIVSTIIGCLMLTSFGFLTVKPLYTANASMYVYNAESRVDYNISTGELSASKQLVTTYIVVLKSNNVLNQVSDKLENYDLTAKQIRSMLSASAIDGTEAFQVSITAPTPEMAKEVCNTILKVAPNEIVRVVKAGSVEIIDWAEEPDTAIWSIFKYILAGAFLGFAASFSYVLLRVIFGTIINDEIMLEENFDIPIIGIIPMETIEKMERR
ncbi:YveK family protein [Anaerosporobacter sp.]|uniref:YveK family protein n=1 Tax=Anaerosporobacter sp. TaxID=1872529 RepID=UPI00286F73DE|nr:Wzz/FepE/Etk N-terminal domain-containing protein [Anaerosporobacter sp.]